MAERIGFQIEPSQTEIKTPYDIPEAVEQLYGQTAAVAVVIAALCKSFGWSPGIIRELAKTWELKGDHPENTVEEFEAFLMRISLAIASLDKD